MFTAREIEEIRARAGRRGNAARARDRLVRTAIHEAGHAVAALTLGFRVHGAHLLFDDLINGACYVSPDPTAEGQRGAVVLAAGDMAVALAEGGLPVPARRPEAEWYGRRLLAFVGVQGYRLAASEPPLVRSEPAVSDRSLVAPEADAERAMREAGLLLYDRWHAVYAVADGLLAQGRLEEAEVLRLAGPVPPFAPARPAAALVAARSEDAAGEVELPEAAAENLARAAVHAAGHVVAAAAYGARIDRAELLRLDDDGFYASCWIAGELTEPPGAVIAAAGDAALALAAEGLPAPGARHAGRWAATRRDARVSEFLRGYESDEKLIRVYYGTGAVDEARAVAGEVLRRRWAQVQAVAAALIEAGSLDRAALERLAGAASAPGALPAPPGPSPRRGTQDPTLSKIIRSWRVKPWRTNCIIGRRAA